MPRNVPEERAATRSSVASAVDERAPLPERLPEKVVVSGASVAAMVDERAPPPDPAHVEPRVSVAVADEYNEVTPDWPAVDAQLTGDRSKGAKPTVRPNRRAPTLPRPPETCGCLAGDPLCGCLD
jgi:hypothetical protein